MILCSKWVKGRLVGDMSRVWVIWDMNERLLNDDMGMELLVGDMNME